MALELNGTTGVSLVQDGIITAADLASGAITSSALPAGSVLQVVNATYNTSTATTSVTYIDTGLTATITPSSTDSKILVLVNQTGLRKATSAYLGLKLYRDATQIVQIATTTAYTQSTAVNSIGSDATCYLDSPASTSAVTYKTQFNCTSTGTTWVQVGGVASTITLMEIAG